MSIACGRPALALATVVPRGRARPTRRAGSLALQPQTVELELVEELADEGLDQEFPRRTVGQAPAAQVEHRLLVEPSDRGAVRALDVVGVDLELGPRLGQG